jgi:hypothetical protein
VEIVASEGAVPIFAMDVPCVHPELDCLDIETDCANCRDVVTQLEFVEHSCFASGIKTKHQAASLAVLEPFLEDAEECTHSHYDSEMSILRIFEFLNFVKQVPMADRR